MKVFLDTNILLDYGEVRDDFVYAKAILFGKDLTSIIETDFKDEPKADVNGDDSRKGCAPP